MAAEIALIEAQRPRKEDAERALDAQLGGFAVELWTTFYANLKLRRR